MLITELASHAVTTTPLAIIGCGCSNSTEALTELLVQSNFTDVPVVR